MKLVSLILTTFNCKENLEKTLQSIEGQDYPNLEVVIKDGGSTDGTLDVIRHYQKASRFKVEWVSVEDAGLYDAMNQGLALSTGEIILFFNDNLPMGRWYPNASMPWSGKARTASTGIWSMRIMAW